MGRPSTALGYLDSHDFDGNHVDVFTPVTAEVLLEDAFVPPEAKKAFVVKDGEEVEELKRPPHPKAPSPEDSDDDLPIHIWDTSVAATLEGGALKTYNILQPEVEHVQLCLKNQGTPLNAKADVFCSGGHAPMQLAVYSDNGATHPFSGIICTPFLMNHSIGVKNSGKQSEHPLSTAVVADMEHLYNGVGESSLGKLADNLLQFATVRRIHGGDSEAFCFHKPVESVQVLLRTDGRPCQARIELTSGRDGETIQQVVEVYTEDGLSRPFFAVLDTPDLSNLVRVVNVGDEAFPISACVEPYMVDADFVPPSDDFPQHPPPPPEEIGFDTMPHPPPHMNHGQSPPFHGYDEDACEIPLVDVDLSGIPGIEDDTGFFFMDDDHHEC
ncbi:MAG: hypothetical protein SGARI_001392 [Bacillariaceae sp.]